MEELLVADEIGAAQEQLDRELKAALSPRGPHRLGYRGGGKVLDLYSSGRHRLYYASVFLDRSDTARRFWNAFGFYDGRVNSLQRIVVEINIPIPPTRRVAAFFARDAGSGQIILLHDGRIGGGKKGVCREAFLRHSGLQQIAIGSTVHARQALPVATLGDPNLLRDINTFVRAVYVFKKSLDSR